MLSVNYNNIWACQWQKQALLQDVHSQRAVAPRDFWTVTAAAFSLHAGPIKTIVVGISHQKLHWKIRSRLNNPDAIQTMHEWDMSVCLVYFIDKMLLLCNYQQGTRPERWVSNLATVSRHLKYKHKNLKTIVGSVSFSKMSDGKMVTVESISYHVVLCSTLQLCSLSFD